MGRYTRKADQLAPNTPDGYLYYVRVSSLLGPFYKIGYTKSKCIEQRFAFDSHHQSELEAVFLFAYHQSAYHKEQQLHTYFAQTNAFGAFSSSPFLPMFRNGQSELYPRDILGLDPEYTEEQGRRTIANLPNRYKKPGKFATANWWNTGLWMLLGVGQNGGGNHPNVNSASTAPDKEGEGTVPVQINYLLEWIREQAILYKSMRSSSS